MPVVNARSQTANHRYEVLSRRRSALVRNLTVTILVAFFAQQVLTNFTDVLDGFVLDGLSWAYVYAFALFALVVALTAVYTRSMDRVEREVATSEEGEG